MAEEASDFQQMLLKRLNSMQQNKSKTLDRPKKVQPDPPMPVPPKSNVRQLSQNLFPDASKTGSSTPQRRVRRESPHSVSPRDVAEAGIEKISPQRSGSIRAKINAMQESPGPGKYASVNGRDSSSRRSDSIRKTGGPPPPPLAPKKMDRGPGVAPKAPKPTPSSTNFEDREEDVKEITTNRSGNSTRKMAAELSSKMGWSGSHESSKRDETMPSKFPKPHKQDDWSGSHENSRRDESMPSKFPKPHKQDDNTSKMGWSGSRDNSKRDESMPSRFPKPHKQETVGGSKMKPVESPSGTREEKVSAINENRNPSQSNAGTAPWARARNKEEEEEAHYDDDDQPTYLNFGSKGTAGYIPPDSIPVEPERNTKQDGGHARPPPVASKGQNQTTDNNEAPPIRQQWSRPSQKSHPSSKPHPIPMAETTGEETPPVPKREQSTRHKASVTTESGDGSCPTPGTSGDGLVRHPTTAREKNRRGKAEDHMIAPMGSSSESDFSGDGVIRRNDQRAAATNKNVPAVSSPILHRKLPQSQPPLPKTDPPAAPPFNIHQNQDTPPGAAPFGGGQHQKRFPHHSERRGSIKRRNSSRKERKGSALIPESPIKLLDFVSKYSHFLPVQVKVRDGICSENSDINVPKDEIFNLHFLKSMKVAVLNDTENVETYSVPFHSSITFGLIYNPSESDENASPYMQIRTAGEVMKLSQLPLIVTATNTYDGGSPEKSVTENEILFVKEVTRGGMKKGNRLHVVTTDGQDKFLSSKCAGNFSTDPRHMKLHPSVLLSQGLPLPQYVVIYGNREVRNHLPTHMVNTPILLTAMEEKTSVIATMGELSNVQVAESTLYDMSMDTNISIDPLQLPDPEKENLKQITDYFFYHFHTKEKQFIIEKSSHKALQLQIYFNNQLLENAHEGVELHYFSRSSSLSERSTRNSSVSDSVTDSAAKISTEETSSIEESFPHENIGQHEMTGLSVPAKNIDTISICSHASGNAVEASSDIVADQTSYNDDMEDEDPLYEDIDSIAQSCTPEQAQVLGFTKDPKISSKKNKIFKMLKAAKGTWKKTKHTPAESEHEPTADLELHEEDEIAMNKREVPPIPAHSHSSSEAEEIKSTNSGNVSDSYEDVGFNQIPIDPVKEEQVVSKHLPFDDIKAKRSLLQRSAIVKESRGDTITDDSGYAGPDVVKLPPDVIEKRQQLKEEQISKASYTLPRKFKLEKITKSKGSDPSPSTAVATALPAVPVSTEELSSSTLSEEMKALKMEMENLKAQMNQLSSTVETLMARSYPGGGEGSGSSKLAGGVSENIRTLQRMTLDQVLKLLDAMDISQYKQHFIKERVTGMVLTEVDDEMLMADLKMTSRLHRIRLMKVASGQVSVGSVMDTKYVKFTK